MAKKRLKIKDKQGNVVDYDISAASVTIDIEGKSLDVKLSEIAAALLQSVTEVTFNGTPHNRENGKINLGNQMQPDWSESSQTYPSYIRNKPNVVTGIKVGASGSTITPTNGVVVLPESGDTVECDNSMSSTSENPVQNKVIKAYVDNLIAGLVNGAPAALDTLNELSAALGNDANFATTILNAIADKVDKVTGYGLSKNDYTDADKAAVGTIGSKANAADVPSKVSDLTNDAGYVTEDDVEGMMEVSVPTIDSVTGNWIIGGQVTQYPSRGQDGNSGVASADGVESVKNLNGGTTDTSSKVYVLGANQGKRLKDQIDYVYARLQAVYAQLGNIAFWDGKPNSSNILPNLDWGNPRHDVTLTLLLSNAVVTDGNGNPFSSGVVQVEEGGTLALTIEPASGYAFASAPSVSVGGNSVTPTPNQDGTYTVAITMGQSNIAVSISATASVEDYDVPAGGEMVFFLDGTDLTDGATTWVDKVGNVQFSGSGSVVKVNGVPVGMSFNNQVMSIDSTLNFSPVTHTIEVVAKPISVNNYKYNYLFTDGNSSPDNGGKSEAIYAILYKDGNNMYMNGVFVDGTGTQGQDGSWTNGNVWSMPFTLGSNVCIGANKTCAVNNGVQMSSKGEVHWTSIYGKAALGGNRNNQNGFFYANTVVYAIRIYRGQLTAEQMLHNQKIDNVRYSLGLTLPDSVS